MTIRRTCFWASLLPAMLVALSTAPADVSAQTTYACKTQSGIAYRSSAPCPRSNQTPGMVYYGPTEKPRHDSSRPPPKVDRAGEEIGYMSAKCATMQDGIRTGPARGLSRETLQEARNTFNRECGDERRKASREVWKDKREREKAAEREQELAQQRKQESSAAEERYRNQCAEMRISIRSRKQRANPTEGELRDLALFESRFKDRCGE
ncbi:hypothetical protein J2W49_003542 [Hydrogenophaga palleronii]|uniref:DUF4124 domain-containing protein n=1 Tax=Hydrogenophaga palleronii TaxID=65655 RepID=A0ABU1WQJ1_9BURK|nr:hypothetical protein [Hydrogenophaga palleronii]MDR7151566.1 hypothetical protein [Hydrogenophaga palleronii]